MECNMEEAIRAREIAEKKMQNKDFVGARKVALKAKQLYPDLENISQMLSVCDIHCSSEHRAGANEMDWYGILQVEFRADEMSIKKQFRKLALILHPDKNKFPGAEAAFKLVVEAQRVLLDPLKRSQHDMKRRGATSIAVGRQPAQSDMASHARSQPDTRNHFMNQTGSLKTQSHFMNQTGTKNHFTNHNQSPSMAPHLQQTLGAFWTTCSFCGMRYQYYRHLMYKTLRCQSCMMSFVAYDLNAGGASFGMNPVHQDIRSSIPQQRDAQSQGTQRACPQYNAGNNSSDVVSEGNVKGGKTPKVENVVEAGLGASKTEPSDNRNRRRRRAVIESSESCGTSSTDSEKAMKKEDFPDMENVEVTGSSYPRRSIRQKRTVIYNEDGSDDDFMTSPASKRSNRDMHSNEVSSSDDISKSKDLPGAPKSSEVKNEEKEKGNSSSESGLPNVREIFENNEKLHKAEVNEEDLEKSFKVNEEDLEKSFKTVGNSGQGPSGESGSEVDEDALFYSDPEFHDFDQDRTEKKFEPNQIWAVYDDCDGMPRFYAQIKKVSLPDFKLKFTWLEPEPIHEDEIAWYDKDLPVACGIFKLGDTENSETCGMFSYIVSWEKGTKRGTYTIWPKKGDIWALFKGWDAKWSLDEETDRIFEYEIVEVLSDYTEEAGVEVVDLVKLKGFTSLFQRVAINGKNSFQIPSRELLKFSHKIPSYRMSGKEREGVTEGSFELDPASVPAGMEEFEASTSHDKVAVEPTILDSQDKDLCSKLVGKGKMSATESDNPDEPKKRDSNLEDTWEKENHEPSVYSSGRASKVYENLIVLDETPCKTKKRASLDCGKSTASGVSDDKKSSEVDVPKSDVDRKKKENHSVGSSTPLYSGDTYELPDPEFHNFETDKTIDKFQQGQFWALYSDEDGMPKYYARIENVVDSEGFCVQTKWLDPCPVSEEETRWYRAELPMGCGTFKVARSSETYKTSGIFSHKIQPESTLKGKYAIGPRKGEVWAVYKNWRFGWCIADLVECEYEIVEIGDIGSDIRVQVLRKVEGYRSVFKRVGDTKAIPGDELLSFSHQIPAFPLTEERGGKLRGYLELDPASLPVGLLFATSN